MRALWSNHTVRWLCPARRRHRHTDWSTKKFFAEPEGIRMRRPLPRQLPSASQSITRHQFCPRVIPFCSATSADRDETLCLRSQEGD